MDRDVFVSTYVSLRVAALNHDSDVISDSSRARILTEHGVSEDDLLRFAEVHGEDLDFMRDVWNDVELRLDVERPADPASN